MEFKCKLKDLVDDLIQLGVTEIKLDTTGLGLCASDMMKERGIFVKEWRRTKRR